MVELNALVADLRAESAEVDRMVADLPADAWRTPTPAPRWTVAHQIAHLAWTDQQALFAITNPAAFQAEFARVVSANPLAESGDAVDRAAAEGAEAGPAELLDTWRRGREDLAAAIERVPAGTKVPWFGPPMPAASMTTARIMETWAHGNDIADALGITRTPTARLRHVAHIGVRTRDWAYVVRQLPPPAEPFRVELTGPDGELWTWGPQDAAQRVTGPALDFSLLTTQRVHRADTTLEAVGPDARQWLDIAQAFAGPPGEGRAPR